MNTFFTISETPTVKELVLQREQAINNKENLSPEQLALLSPLTTNEAFKKCLESKGYSKEMIGGIIKLICTTPQYDGSKCISRFWIHIKSLAGILETDVEFSLMKSDNGDLLTKELYAAIEKRALTYVMNLFESMVNLNG